MSRLPAAVIVGADLNGLGVVRSLASLNMPIFVVGKSRFDSAMLSRFAHPVVTPRLEGADLVSVLIELGPKIGGDAVLFITDEIAVETISASRKVLEKFYRFTMPPPDTVDMLMDKRRFHQFAMDRGLPVPVSIGITGKETLSELARLDYPVVIKPCDKMLVHTGQIARLGVARHRTEAEAICRDMLPVAQSLIVRMDPRPAGEYLLLSVLSGRGWWHRAILCRSQAGLRSAAGRQHGGLRTGLRMAGRNSGLH